MPTRLRRRLRHLTAAAVVALVGAGTAVIAAPPAEARQATGGQGRFVSEIQWMDFGSAGQVIPAGGVTKTTEFTLGGRPAKFTCRVGSISGGQLSAYSSGKWQGDALDDLYNIGGTGSSNRLVNGLLGPDHGASHFDFDCWASVDGRPLPLAGLVFADAEQSNYNESVAATAPAGATWRVIDRYRDPSCSESSRASVAGNRLTLIGPPSWTSGPQCGSGPSVVAFLDGATSATNVTVTGGGRSAIALGAYLAVSTDTGSGALGAAAHLQQPAWSGGAAIGTGTRVSDSGFALATPQETTPRLGSSARRVDGFRLPSEVATRPGQTFTLPVDCRGNSATVAGWIDWNGDGAWQPGERAQSSCAADSLTWTVPDDMVPGDHRVRVRVASDAADVASAVGMALDGEVEGDTVTVTLLQPQAAADHYVTEQNTPKTLDVLANDSAASEDLPFDRDSLRLVDGGTLVGEQTTVGGTATVRDGAVSFRPAPGFSGTFGPLSYSVADGTGARATATFDVDVTAVRPAPQPDSAIIRQGGEARVDVLANDRAGNAATPIDADSLQLLDGTDRVDELVVPGEGTWRTRGGFVVFTPTPSFTGAATAAYEVADADGTRGSADVTVTVEEVVPTATDDTAVVRQGGEVAVDVLANDTAGNADVPLDPTTLTVTDGANQAAGTFSARDGEVAFAPVPSFTGEATATYQVADVNGTLTSATLTVTVTPVTPAAVDDMAEVRQGGALTVDVLANDTAGNADVPLDPDTLVIADTDQPDGAFEVRDGEVAFAPAKSFTGDAIATYQVADVNGTLTSATLTVTVTPVTPASVDDMAEVRQGGALTVDVLANDTAGNADVPLDPDTLVIADTDQPDGAFEVRDGEVAFAPVPSFTGEATATYQVADVNGTLTSARLTVTVTPVVPIGTEDLVATEQSDPVLADVLANDLPGHPDVPIEPSTLRLVDGEQAVDEITVPGVGTFRVEDGAVRFAPERTFVGATSTAYDVADANGTHLRSELTVTVAAVVPTVADDRVETDQAAPVDVPVLANDEPGRPATPIDAATLRLVEPGAGTRAEDAEGADGRGDTAGTWSVTADHHLRFAPETDFVGDAVATYAVQDANGTEVSAVVTVTVVAAEMEARPDRVEGVEGAPVSVDPLANDTATRGGALDPRSVRFIDPLTDEVQIRDDGRTAVSEGQGTWRIDPETGAVTFDGAPGFAGTAHPVRYSVANVHGVTAESSIVVVLRERPAELAFTGASIGGVAAVAAVLSLLGIALVRRRRDA